MPPVPAQPKDPRGCRMNWADSIALIVLMLGSFALFGFAIWRNTR